MFYRLLALCLLFPSAVPTWADSSISLHPTARFILNASVGRKLLHQCSRSTPANVSGYWQPSAGQVEQLEVKLKAYLSARNMADEQVPPKATSYHRQYIGIVSDRAYLIYGNFYPDYQGRSINETAVPYVMCDGGPSFWGIAYDIKTGDFMEPRFNGR